MEDRTASNWVMSTQHVMFFFLWGDSIRASSVKAQSRGRQGGRHQVQQLHGPEWHLGQRERRQRTQEEEEKEAGVLAATEIMISPVFLHNSFKI